MRASMMVVAALAMPRKWRNADDRAGMSGSRNGSEEDVQFSGRPCIGSCYVLGVTGCGSYPCQPWMDGSTGTPLAARTALDSVLPSIHEPCDQYTSVVQYTNVRNSPDMWPNQTGTARAAAFYGEAGIIELRYTFNTVRG